MQYQLADLWECLCDAGPDAAVLVAGDRRFSRAELDSRANRLAHHLLSEGIESGDRVGVYAYNRAEWIETLLACWKIRAIAVNINYRYVTDELRYLWDDSDMVALVYERGFSESVATLAVDFPQLRTYLMVEPGLSVCVIGCGGIGIAAIQGARISGAAVIVAVDSVTAKLEMAKRFGATHAVLPEDLEGAKLEVTAGEGFDTALECVGDPRTIRAAYDAVHRGGTAVVVGMGRSDQKIEFDAFELLFSEKKLLGSFYGGANVRVDFPRLLRLWKAGKLDLEGMITQRIRIEDVNDAFRAMEAGEVIRSVIDFDDDLSASSSSSGASG
jgi:hypothetical protein